MLLSENELRKIIRQEIYKDMLNEFRLGRIRGGSQTEVCDLSDVPESLFRYLNAFKSGRKDNLLKEIDVSIREMRQSGNLDDVEKLENKKIELMSDTGDGVFENMLSKLLTNDLTKLMSSLGGGLLTIAFGYTKTDCDYIKKQLQVFMNIVGEIFGIDMSISSGRSLVGVSAGVATGKNLNDVTFKFMETFFKEVRKRRFINKEKRKFLNRREDVTKSEMTDFDLDLFELLAPAQYDLFCKDPEDKKIKAAKPILKEFAKQISQEQSSFSRLINLFAFSVNNLDPNVDVRLKNFIKKDFEFQEYFETPEMFANFIQQRIKLVLDEIDIFSFF